MCTFDEKNKNVQFIGTLRSDSHYIKKTSPQSAIVKPLQQGAQDG